MINIFKLIFTLIISMFATKQADEKPKHEEGAVTIVREESKAIESTTERVDAIAIAREYIPKSEREKRIVIKHDNREIMDTRGKQIDVDNWCSVFRVIAKTILDDKIVLHVART